MCQLPKGRSPSTFDKWIEELTDIKFAELMSEVLNNEGHSLLTLAAHEKKTEMLEFLISELKIKVLEYGPQSWHHVDLDGFEQPHCRGDYIPPVPSSIAMYGAINWLCIVNGMGSGEKVEPPVGFRIPAVKQIIETKWDRIGKPVFLRRYYVSFFNMVMVTLIACNADFLPAMIPVLETNAPTGMPTAVPTAYPSYKPSISLRPVPAIKLQARPAPRASPTYAPFALEPTVAVSKFPSFQVPPMEASITILYVLTTLSMLWLLLPDVPYMLNYTQLRGAAKVEKYTCLVMFFSFCSMCLCKVYSYYSYESVYQVDDQLSYPRFDHRGIEISLAVCVLSSWVYMFYFLMGFDSTGLVPYTVVCILTVLHPLINVSAGRLFSRSSPSSPRTCPTSCSTTSSSSLHSVVHWPW
jgi:hypothetical protein